MIDKVLGSEFAMAVLLVAVPWGLAKLLGWLGAKAAQLKDERVNVAMSALDQGVHEAWEDVGRRWKGAHQDGKFTDTEREDLRARALEVAKDVGREQGVDVVKEIGRYGIALLIKKIVDRRKHGTERTADVS